MHKLVNVLVPSALALVLVGSTACQTASAAKPAATTSLHGQNLLPFDDLPVGLPVAGPLYFETDTDLLTDESKAMLRRIAGYMRDRDDAHLVVTGNCDERGDAAYNLALGERRAYAAKQYLQLLGVEGERVRAVSLGEEVPVVEGSDEVAWAWNRRDEFQFVHAGQQTAAIAQRIALPPAE